MTGQAPERRSVGPGLIWPLAWAVVLMSCTYGLYILHQRRIFHEEQFVLLVMVIVPVAAFLLSGTGQDRTEQPAANRDERSPK